MGDPSMMFATEVTKVPHDARIPRNPAIRVDWNAPHLQALLKKSEGWKVDNRDSFVSENVMVHLNGTSVAQHGRLVRTHNDVVVLETSFPIDVGELVRIDWPYGETFKIQWVQVTESRTGQRCDDRDKGIHVHWLHACNSSR